MNKLRLKACPKCSGALYLAEDEYGCYISCLNCGLIKELAEPDLAPEGRVIAISRKNAGLARAG